MKDMTTNENVIFFGAKDKNQPFPRINFASNLDGSRFFSRSNFNLFLTDDKSRFVSLGTILDSSHYAGFSAENRELAFAPEVCNECADKSSNCPLIVDHINDQVIFDEALPIKWWELKRTSDLLSWHNVCPFFSKLCDLSETAAEKKFQTLYLDAHLRYYASDLYDRLIDDGVDFMDELGKHVHDVLLSKPYARPHRKLGKIPKTVAFVLPEEYDRQINSDATPNDRGNTRQMRNLLDRVGAIASKAYKANIGIAANITASEAYEIGRWLRTSLYHFPALIPQVWLRHIYEPSLGPTDPLRDEAYSRVDFVVLWNGKKVVIEIDGPEHYASWDKTNREWKVSEQIYTRNLVRERQLRKNGWEFVRLSNQEIQEANNWFDIESKIHLNDLLDNTGETPKPDDYPDHYYIESIE
jgi:hypothetical protein